MAKNSANKQIYKGELGGSGTTSYQGVVNNADYNPLLNTEYGGSGLDIYDRMRKSDSTVRASLNIVKLGIQQAEWSVEAAEDEGEEEEVSNFVRQALFEKIDRPWQEVLREILTYLDFGFYVCEKVFKIEDDGKIYWDKLAYRDQKSIVRFETKDHEPGVVQHLSGDEVKEKGITDISIPRERLLIFTNEKEGDNMRGVSLLRGAYKSWFFKENLEKIDMMGFERESIGVPVFTMPQSPDPNDVAKAEELGENLRANEKAYICLPYDWTFEVQYPTGGQRRNSNEALGRFDRQIFMNVLAAFLDLGSGPSGSRALSEDQSDAFYKSIKTLGDYICSIFNKDAIPQLVDLNFNGIKNYPKLKVAGIEKINLEAFSNALQRFVLSKVLTPDDEVEDYVRDIMGLPDMPEMDEREDEEINRGVGTTDPNDPANPLSPNNPFNPMNPVNNKDKDNLPNKDSKKKEMRDRIFSYPNAWRQLTFAEEKVNFESLKAQWDRLEADIDSELPVILAPEIASLENDAKIAIQFGDAKRVEDLTIKFKAEVRNYINKKIAQAFEVGKLSAANEMKVKAPSTSNELVSLLSTKGSVITDKLTVDLLNKAKLTSISHIEQKTNVSEALQSISNILSDQLMQSVSLTSSVITAGGINMGRETVFKEYKNMVYAKQRSEILDNRVCNYCLSIDGRIVEPDDPITNTSQFHFRCRGIWVEILVDEAELPDITGIPQSLRDRIGTIEEFEQMDKPMPLKNSLADDFVNMRNSQNVVGKRYAGRHTH
jgi:hypothetical protein